MAPKRKHTTLTLKLKWEILNQLKQGVSGKKLAVKYGIGTSTISDIKKQQNKIESFIANCDSDPGSRKTLKKPEYPEMEAELYSWFLQQKSNEITVSYEALAQKAKHFFVKCYANDNFSASRGWVMNFKKRHGLQTLKESRRKLQRGSSEEEPYN